MNWILIAIASGMIMTSSHDTEEACLGRKAILEKDKITNSKCVNMQNITYQNIGNTITWCPAYTSDGRCIK